MKFCTFHLPYGHFKLHFIIIKGKIPLTSIQQGHMQLNDFRFSPKTINHRIQIWVSENVPQETHRPPLNLTTFAAKLIFRKYRAGCNQSTDLNLAQISKVHHMLRYPSNLSQKLFLAFQKKKKRIDENSLTVFVMALKMAKLTSFNFWWK